MKSQCWVRGGVGGGGPGDSFWVSILKTSNLIWGKAYDVWLAGGGRGGAGRFRLS